MQTIKHEENKTVEFVNRLFIELKALCPLHNIAWPDQEVYDKAKRLWLSTFIEKGLNNWNKIQFGLQKLRDSGTKYVPTVNEFISLCYPTPQELGIPSVQESYTQCCKRASEAFKDDVFTHATIAYLYHQSSKERFRNAVKREDELTFQRDYEIIVRACVNGEPLPQLTKALTVDTIADERRCRKSDIKSLLTMCGK